MLGKDLEIAGEKLSTRVVNRLGGQRQGLRCPRRRTAGVRGSSDDEGQTVLSSQYRQHGRTRRIAPGQHEVVKAESRLRRHVP